MQWMVGFLLKGKLSHNCLSLHLLTCKNVYRYSINIGEISDPQAAGDKKLYTIYLCFLVPAFILDRKYFPCTCIRSHYSPLYSNDRHLKM